MEKYLTLIYLILALILAAALTRWFNWLAWGERRGKKLDRIKQSRTKLNGKNDDAPGS